MQPELQMDKSLIESVLREERALDVAKVLELVAEPGVGKYNNYLSDVLRLRARVLRSDQQETSVSLILKKELQGKALDTIINEMNAYQTEILVYSSILKEMEKLLEEINEERLWPKYYGCYGNNILLEDLKELGYRLTEKHTEQTYDHAVLVMKALGKFHALSMVLVQRGMFDPTVLKPVMYSRDIAFLNNFYYNAIDDLIQAIPSWGTEWEEFPALLRTAVSDLGTKMSALNEQSKSTCPVLNHGDCWNNNVMFKYLQGTPISVRLLDLQVCHYSSLGWDLNYYLYSTTYPDSRERYLNSLLETYRDSLARTCTNLNYRGHVYTLSEVQDALQEVRYFGFFTAICHIPIHMSSTKEDFDLNIDNFVGDRSNQTNFCRSPKVINVLKKLLLKFKGYGII